MTTTTEDQSPGYIPPVVDRLIRGLDLTELSIVNPTPREGERATHTTAVRLWIGGRANPTRYLDDGYDFMQAVAELVDDASWRPDARFGDWPMVVEIFKVHDPADDRSWHDDPDDRPLVPAGSYFRYYRATYLEGAVFLAEYGSLNDARADARPA